MEQNKDQWIQEAFEKAQPTLNGVTTTEISEKAFDAFREQFPIIMMAYKDAFGIERAMKVGRLVLQEPELLKLLEVTFGTGMIYDEIKKIRNQE